MKIIGITGGIGTGKSTVAAMLRERGWPIISSDDVGKELMDNDAEVRAALAGLFGQDVLLPGTVNRGAIAAAIFGSTDEHRRVKKELEKVIHPRVIASNLAWLESQRTAGSPLAAIESALLYEVGLEDGFDHVIVVDAPLDVRVARVRERSGLSEEEVQARIDEQMPMQEKRSAADFVIDNSGTLDNLRNAVQLVAMVIEALPDPEADEAEEPSEQ